MSTPPWQVRLRAGESLFAVRSRERTQSQFSAAHSRTCVFPNCHQNFAKRRDAEGGKALLELVRNEQIVHLIAWQQLGRVATPPVKHARESQLPVLEHRVACVRTKTSAASSINCRQVGR